MADPVSTSEVIVGAASYNWAFKDWVYLAGVSVSVISASIAAFSAWMTARRDLNSLGDSEIKIYELISKAVFESAKFQMKLKEQADKGGTEYKISNADNSLLNVYLEAVLNAYDIACQRFLDKKLDEQRFAATYQKAIGKLFDNPLYKNILDARKLQYSALNKVNNLLNDNENFPRRGSFFSRWGR